MKDIYIILHNIRSIHNVGSMFRTADASGVKKIYLCGYTPTPVDRFGRNRRDISKVALGAENIVQWEYEEDIERVIDKLKKENKQVVAVEQDKNSISYKDFILEKDTAFILGEERNGIEKSILNKCDKIIEIGMKGRKESLNVSVACGIVLFRFVE